MSRLGSYKNTAFSESQKFLVLDPSTSSASLVLASELVAYITPSINSVKAESTRLSAENTDYKVGELVQTSGATAIGDGLASVYLVVAGGSGDFPMLNGNDLLVIAGDDALREQLISEVAGQGASLVSMEGGPTVEASVTAAEAAILNRVIRVSSVSESFAGLSGSLDFQYSVISYYNGGSAEVTPLGGGVFVYKSGVDKSTHNGGTIISPTVPGVSASSLSQFLSGALDTDPGGTGCFVKITENFVYVDEFGGLPGALPSNISVQAAVTAETKVKFRDSSYTFNAGVDIDSALEISGGTGTTINFDGNTLTPFNVSSSAAYAKFYNINFVAATSAATAAPVAIRALNCESITITECQFKDCRVRGENDTNALLDTFEFSSNSGNSDFSLYDITVTQNDVLTIRGYANVDINNNQFAVLNIFRAIKIQTSTFAFVDGYADSTTSPENIKIHKNKFSGSTTSGKQLVDMFTCKAKLSLICKNDVDVSGFNSAFENKTNRGNVETDSLDLYLFNKIKCSAWAIFYEATRGNTASAGVFDKGNRRVVLEGNEITIDPATSANAGVQLRYLQSGAILGGTISVTAGKNIQSVELGGNFSEEISNVKLSGSFVRLVDSTGSNNGDTHNAKTDSIVISNNTAKDCSNPLQGFFVLRQLINADMSIVISGNTATNSVTTASAGGIAVLRDCTFYSMAVSGNSIKQVAIVDERLLKVASVSGTFYQEIGNSWQGAALSV